jgi:DNA-binding CsgD family transcriptional regulator
MREETVIELLSGAGEPALAAGGDGRICCWNRQAVEFTGIGAAEAMGRHCGAVLCGRDAAGNPICGEACRVLEAANGGLAVAPFPMEVVTGKGPAWVSVSTLFSSNPGMRLVHLFRGAEARGRLEQMTHQMVALVGGLTGRGVEELLASEGHRVESTELTAQERRVLRLLARGVRTPGIASQLGVSEATVRNHVHHILAKLGAHSRLEAVLKAAGSGAI